MIQTIIAIVMIVLRAPRMIPSTDPFAYRVHVLLTNGSTA
jgi:hypothetical protein